MIYVAGPGGGPGVVANVYLEQTYTEHYPDVSQDEDGMRRQFRQFSFPGGSKHLDRFHLTTSDPRLRQHFVDSTRFSPWNSECPWVDAADSPGVGPVPTERHGGCRRVHCAAPFRP